jgi:hypothetical protein
VVPAADGKHRRPEDEPPQAPARTSLRTAGFFRPPPDAAGPVDAWGPTRYGTPGSQAVRPRLPVRRPGPLYAVPNDAPAAGHGSGGKAKTADDQAAAIKDEAWDQAAAIRRAAEREAATIRRQAESRAAAIREEAEREAAELRSALLAMSGELGRAAAYVTQNLATPVSPPARRHGADG